MDEQIHSPTLLPFKSSSLQMQTSNQTLSLTPKWSPRVRDGARSNLFDSMELDAVIRQLNGALRATRNDKVTYAEPKNTEYMQKSDKKQKKFTHNDGEGHNYGEGHVPSFWKRIKGAILGTKK
ncbi:uncharacterized protein A4U43_C03F27140 [Asparagus officinalis]|uniref:Uncharacterized protein n=1 Tax=Asparagus officinalis TaxID=4686 RepID=A0A5P1FDA4_ASPOF|nr:uncharacterized protein A4U43_C03F27140 [Asparagus officinalis]